MYFDILHEKRTANGKTENRNSIVLIGSIIRNTETGGRV